MIELQGRLLLVLIAGLMAPPALLAQEPALRGLQVVGIYVPVVDELASVTMPDSTRLGDILELRLRREGLGVERNFERVTGSYLKFEVKCLEGKANPVYACSATLALRQLVDLRENRGRAFADVWSRGAVILVTRSLLASAVEQYANTLADAFVLDWLRENPKR